MEDLNNQIYQLGKLAYTPNEVARIMGIPEEELSEYLLDTDSVFYRSYYKGYFETDIQLRNSILKLAVAGSSPAQAMANNIIKQNILKQHG